MTTHPQRIEQPPVGLRRLWAGVLLAPVGWVLLEGIGYYHAARSCEPGTGGVPLAGTAHPAITQAILCLIALVVGIAGLMISRDNVRAVGGRPHGEESPELGRARFMAYGGVLLSVLFIGGIVLFAVPLVFLNTCSQAR